MSPGGFDSVIVDPDGDGLLVAVADVALPVGGAETDAGVERLGAAEVGTALVVRCVVGKGVGVEAHAETASMMAAAVAAVAREIGE